MFDTNTLTTDLTMLARIVMALAIATCLSPMDQEADEKVVPAKWRQELSSTRPVGYKPGEYLVKSNIVTGTTGVNAEVRYGLEVKVDALDKVFRKSHTYERQGKKYTETLSIKLRTTTLPRELSAEYDHTVEEDGKPHLRFAGTTVLHHWSRKE